VSPDSCIVFANYEAGASLDGRGHTFTYTGGIFSFSFFLYFSPSTPFHLALLLFLHLNISGKSDSSRRLPEVRKSADSELEHRRHQQQSGIDRCERPIFTFCYFHQQQRYQFVCITSSSPPPTN
jgi:hypothetical protein